MSNIFIKLPYEIWAVNIYINLFDIDGIKIEKIIESNLKEINDIFGKETSESKLITIFNDNLTQLIDKAREIYDNI